MKADKCLTEADIKDALDKIKGSVMIVYPMGLPPHDPVKLELDNEEDLSGTQVIPNLFCCWYISYNRVAFEMPL